ncbi:hypothetical protein AGABI2DRAFT_136944 [Agaricus bisporus var. bisporus H97]|uniref:hypothetical protein n=1 Tax=Agaricus bisporus var. bisporus (strain H97 / ATCC MYA-4626 / FGSC 10389) TaxID=936046 RepID=UPI00029F6D38|nr:hypothetical protein AGABI2DRAFT_136944 [Agaricus bisporus var. bisporus H97]EKV46786.1 hypothetical protein AGABI2DRAFT_136944 [Agaricus bisporus var. bisporus H97]
MAGVSMGSLAAEVTLAGGFGFIGTASTSTDSYNSFKGEIASARELLGTTAGLPLPIGVGFLGWLLDKDEEGGKRLLMAALDEPVKSVWFSFGQDLEKWIKFVRDYDAANNRKTIIIVQLSTVAKIQVAIRDWKVDIVVAQGNEAGGHGYTSSPPVKVLVSSVLPLATDGGPLILGAGGVATGTQVAELLKLGVSGVVLGTRFSLTPESRLGEPQKKALLSAGPNLSVRSMAFDEVRNTMGWPRGVDGRGIRTVSVDDYERGDDISVLRAKLQDSQKSGDMSRAVIWAGTGYSLVKELKPAKEVVEELRRECLAHLKN